MERIKMKKRREPTIAEAAEQFVIYKTARGVKEVTARNYRNHFHSMSKYLDMEQPLAAVSKKDLDEFVVRMRESGLAHNSVSSYLRVFCTFLNWCKENGLTTVTMQNIKQEETVKETYTDEELEALLKRPDASCTFCHFRNWVIVSFLLDTGCRAATVRNIHISDVSLEDAQIIFRHTKNGKVQSIPISSRMIVILREYMAIRGGMGADYLFCDEYGGMLSENGLRKAIVTYNRSCGVQKTSLHLYRHTFARKYLLDCGGNAFTLQKLLGHSTLKMTKHYCAIYDADLARDYDHFSPLALMQKPKEKISRR